MKKLIPSLVILTIVSVTNANAQQLIDLPIAPRVDTTDAQVKAVYQLWRAHLSNHPQKFMTIRTGPNAKKEMV